MTPIPVQQARQRMDIQLHCTIQTTLSCLLKITIWGTLEIQSWTELVKWSYSEGLHTISSFTYAFFFFLFLHQCTGYLNNDVGSSSNIRNLPPVVGVSTLVFLEESGKCMKEKLWLDLDSCLQCHTFLEVLKSKLYSCQQPIQTELKLFIQSISILECNRINVKSEEC